MNEQEKFQAGREEMYRLLKLSPLWTDCRIYAVNSQKEIYHEAFAELTIERVGIQDSIEMLDFWQNEDDIYHSGTELLELELIQYSYETATRKMVFTGDKR